MRAAATWRRDAAGSTFDWVRHMLFGKKPAGGAPDSSPATTPASAPAAVAPGAALDPDEARKRAIASKQIAAAFGEIVALAMRTQATRHHTLQDLEWLVAPAVLTGQFALAEAQAKTTGLVTPVGAVLWALVSEETDRRLTAELEAPMRLRPDEWRAGTIPWIVLTLGDQRVVGGTPAKPLREWARELAAVSRLVARGKAEPEPLDD